jgi:DNA modification methylase
VIRILQGDCRDILATLPEQSIQCCVTSPPYFGLRSYLPADHPDKAHEIGTEATPAEYVARLVDVFREVRRVLRDDGVLWLNLGDSYASAGGHSVQGKTSARIGRANVDVANAVRGFRPGIQADGVKTKDLIGIPWMVAFALRADGWYLRQENIWAKRNCMPESVTDRTTRAHETVFMLTKRARYFYDAFAVEEDGKIAAGTRAAKGSNVRSDLKDVNGRPPEYWEYNGRRNKRSVWWEVTMPFHDAHFATMTPKVAETCILAGTSEHGACVTCGAPFMRVVKRHTTMSSGSGKAGNPPAGKHVDNEQAHSGSYDVRMGPTVVSRHVGWKRPCDCPDLHPRNPCVVLDPFGGAGTTALVADRLGRDAIICELSTDFSEIARKRLQQDGGMLTRVEVT